MALLLEVERHLAPESGVPRTPLMLNSIFVHADLCTSLESAGAALIAVRLVYQAGTLVLCLADVLAAAPDGPFEESSATVTGKDAIVLPGRMIRAHLAGDVVQNTAWEKWKISVSTHSIVSRVSKRTWKHNRANETKPIRDTVWHVNYVRVNV